MLPVPMAIVDFSAQHLALAVRSVPGPEQGTTYFYIYDLISFLAHETDIIIIPNLW